MFDELRERIWNAVGSLGRLVRGDEKGAGEQTGGKGLLALITPRAAEGRSRGVQAAMAGGTLVALGAAGAIAATAIAWLVAALAAIYFLMTKVLGLNLEVDPSAFTQSV
jgi:hypothetical protein